MPHSCEDRIEDVMGLFPVSGVSVVNSLVTVLVDADNLTGSRLQSLAEALDVVPPSDRRVVVVGSEEALERASWPDDAVLIEASGWQAADVVLAGEYAHATGPLVIASGDGDFGLLAQRHIGPVLVISGAPSAAYKKPGITRIDPVHEGTAPIRAWLASVLVI